MMSSLRFWFEVITSRSKAIHRHHKALRLVGSSGAEVGLERK